MTERASFLVHKIGQLRREVVIRQRILEHDRMVVELAGERRAESERLLEASREALALAEKEYACLSTSD